MPTIADVLDSYRNNMPGVLDKAVPYYAAGVQQKTEQDKNTLSSVIDAAKLQNEMTQAETSKQELSIKQEDAQRKRVEDYYNKFYGAVSATKDDPEKFKRWQDLGYVPQDLSFGDAEAWLMSGAAYKAAQNLKDSSYYGNPIYAEGPQGTQVYQLNKQGQAKAVQFPAGVTPSKPLMKMDLGGTQAAVNPLTGGVVAQYGVSLKPGEQPEVRYKQAASAEAGKETGVAESSYQDRLAALPRLQALTGELEALGNQATYTAAGIAYNQARRQLGLPVSEGAVARAEYVAKINNEVLPLLRQTFGAQFTEREGNSLKATLGDPNMSPAEKSAVLRSFIKSKSEALATAARRTGREPSQETGGSNVIDFNSLPP